MNLFNLQKRNLVPKCKDLLEVFGAVKVNGYKCPLCGKYPDDYEVTYVCDGETNPQKFNEIVGCNMDGNYWDWDELHCCNNCGTKY